MTSCVFGQKERTVLIEDYNHDGVKDSMVLGAWWGKSVIMINGKTSDVYELDGDGCPCRIKEVVLAPPVLSQKDNRAFLDVMKKQVISMPRANLDPSMEWMIKGVFNKKKLEDNEYFDLVIDPQTNWVESEFKYPENYYMEISGDTLEGLKHRSYLGDDQYLETATKGFLIYYAHNHYRSYSGDSLTLGDSNENYEIYHTSHGIIVKKEDTYKWVFVTDADLTGAPEKLRWES